MKLLVDNNISPFIARGIHVVVEPEGHEVVALRDHFRANTPDVEWIEELGREGGWTVLSGDIQITRRPAERAAWHRSKLNGLFLAPGWRKMRTVEQAGKLLLWWPSLVQAQKVIAPGAIFQLSINPGSKLTQIPI